MEGGKFAEKPGELVGRALDGDARRVQGAFDPQGRMGLGRAIIPVLHRPDFEKLRGGRVFDFRIDRAGPFPAQLILQAGNRQPVFGAEIDLLLAAAVKGAQQSAPLFGGSSFGHPEA